jgi:FdhD protein
VALDVERHNDGCAVAVTDDVAEEVAVGLVFNEQPYAVMMASPQDLEDFACGFALTEGVVADVGQVEGIAIEAHPEGILLRCTIPSAHAEALAARQRGLVGRTGCGLCGVRNLVDAVRVPARVETSVRVDEQAIIRAHCEIGDWQTFNAQTGAVHAAGWADINGRIVAVREDVGRHNALDKLIGHLARAKISPADGFCIITSRASYEMVVKAATAGISVVAAVSAPTALAVRIARDANVTLAGFVRGNRLVVYSHGERLISMTERH